MLNFCEFLATMAGEIKNMPQNARDQLDYIFKEQEKSALQFEAKTKILDQLVTSQLEAQRKELEQREKELEEKEAQIDKIRTLHNLNVKEIEKLQKMVVEIHEEVDTGMETCYLQLMEVKNGMGEFLPILEKNQFELEALQELNQTLIVKERQRNDELQQVRKDLIHFLKNMSPGTSIGVKKMGKLDCKPFHNATKKKYSADRAEDKAIELCSLWKDNLRDQSWHPFKNIQRVEGCIEEVVDEEDEKLKDLKNELGDEVYFAVRTALIEMNEYNPRDRFAVLELWNFMEGRKATVKEGVSFALKQWRLLMPNSN